MPEHVGGPSALFLHTLWSTLLLVTIMSKASGVTKKAKAKAPSLNKAKGPPKSRKSKHAEEESDVVSETEESGTAAVE